ncbi:putative primosomal protein N' [Acidipropionibacterium virtanenii]|uniref:Probable replication restart protein PriA n=2 Tax=Acidipropionibacterium virtanenii TaxID=2057246 RepID=A0A344UU65_9ACTN|nr:putative primosomal protein N' [Acidipropionibacterium virtanenii]
MTEALLEPTEWVAHVCVSSGLAHLDRPFDYLVPDDMDGVTPGVRVRVRLAGRLLDGIVLTVDHERSPGVTLQPLQRLVSEQPVVTENQLELARLVAERWAGTLDEVLRWCVPARHAATEKAEPRAWPRVDTGPATHISGALRALDDGNRFLELVTEGGRPRAHWRVAPVAGPGDADRLGDWRAGIVQAVGAALASGRGALCCLPTVEQVEELTGLLTDSLGAGTVAVLHADQPAAARWRNYLAVIRGQARVVVGTRSAVLAPLADPGLIVVWDEGSDLHDEPRAPYPNTRDVAAMRAQSQHCALLLAGYSCSTRAADWLEHGWLVGISTPLPRLRAATARVRAPGDSDTALQRDPLARRVRLPDLAMSTIAHGLLSGPVLVAVPRAGDLIRPSCGSCRTPIACPVCHGPVRGRREAGGQTRLTCTWCGHELENWHCAHCGSTTVRSGVVGAATTAAELGRSFPDVTVIDSSGDHIHDSVGDEPALVVATPGAEPAAASGYAAAVILDAVQALARPGLDAVAQALDHWFHVAAGVRSGSEDGRVVIVGPPEDRAVQALIRSDPVGWATAELAERAEAGFPPAAFAALIDGAEEAVALAAERLAAALTEAELSEEVTILGPVTEDVTRPGAPASRIVVRCATALASRVTPLLKQLRTAHSMRRESGPLRVRINPTGQL